MTARPRHELVELPGTSDARGALTFAEEPRHVPFAVRRIFLLHHLPPGAVRGGHAHRLQHQFLIMTSGESSITIDNGETRETVRLATPGQGLYCPPMLWLELAGFSDDAVCLCLASGVYDEADYIRSAAEFHRLASGSLHV